MGPVQVRPRAPNAYTPILSLSLAREGTTLASTAKFIYKISVTNFSKHNANLKKGHKSTLISNNFCTDPKLGMLPMSTRWMFLGLVLTCGDLTRDTVEISAKHLRDLLECNRNIDGALDSLQELQLLSYSKIGLFLNRIEKNRIEKNRKELAPNDQIAKSENQNLPTQSAHAVDVVIFKISTDRNIKIKKDLVSSWADTYPKEFLDSSLKEMRNWILSNPHKSPKSAWAKFMNSWFRRGWEHYRTTLKSNPTKITVDDLNEALGGLDDQ